MKGIILIAIALGLFACTKEEMAPSDKTVHLAGYVGVPDAATIASYWKDSVYTGLGSGATVSNVSSLSVDGTSVLIGGWRKLTDSAPLESMIWQDGSATVIDGAFGGPFMASRNNDLVGVWLSPTGWVFDKNGTSQPIIDTAYSFGPTAMAIVGDDVYISGSSSGPPKPPNYSPPQHAQYWKNGQLFFREDEVSYAFSIFLHQNDVYMAGHTYNPDLPNGTACYWKNEQRTDLTQDNVNALAKSVFVADGHVYVAGMIDDQAVYWKDGTAIPLTIAGTNSMANAIFVDGADVHVAGYEHGHPAYWKNGVKQKIQNQDKPGKIKFIIVGSN